MFAATKICNVSVQLTGRRPIVFDRYSGDNKAKLETHNKLYLDGEEKDQERGLFIPHLNLFSLLCAENTKSVARIGPKNQAAARRELAMAIAASVNFTPAKIPLLGLGGRQIMWKREGGNPQIKVRYDIARVKSGVPNPKIRPMIELPWFLEFKIELAPHENCSFTLLRQAFVAGERIGLGTFRPYFGHYKVTKFEDV